MNNSDRLLFDRGSLNIKSNSERDCDETDEDQPEEDGAERTLSDNKAKSGPADESVEISVSAGRFMNIGSASFGIKQNLLIIRLGQFCNLIGWKCLGRVTVGAPSMQAVDENSYDDKERNSRKDNSSLVYCLFGVYPGLSHFLLSVLTYSYWENPLENLHYV